MSYIQEAKNLLEDKKTTFSLLLEKLCELEREHGSLKTEIKLGLNKETEVLRKFIEIISTIDTLKTQIEKRVNKLAERKLKIKNPSHGKKTRFSALLDELCELERKYGSLKTKIKLSFSVGFSISFSVGFRESLQNLSETSTAADELKLKLKLKRRVRQLAKSKG